MFLKLRYIRPLYTCLREVDVLEQIFNAFPEVSATMLPEIGITNRRGLAFTGLYEYPRPFKEGRTELLC